MSAEEFASLSEEILVREIKFRVFDQGCRVHEVTLVTTLLDPEFYPAAEIANLYRLRWQVEICQPYCLLCHGFYHVTVRGFGVVSSAA
jgi:hypothetical protein